MSGKKKNPINNGLLDYRVVKKMSEKEFQDFIRSYFLEEGNLKSILSSMRSDLMVIMAEMQEDSEEVEFA
ncbi:MAG: hypothetical protein ABIH38_02045 [Patescibacteria group bacterium]